MLPVLRLQDEHEARAYLHPVRVRILRMLIRQPMTQTQVAAAMDVHPANLTHHFKKLRDAALVELVEERDLGRVVEKYYRARARRFEIDPADSGPIEGVGARAVAVLQDDLAAAAAQLSPDSTDLLCLLANEPLSPGRFEQMCERLQAVVQEFRALAEAEPDPDARPYSLNVSLIPRDPDR